MYPVVYALFYLHSTTNTMHTSKQMRTTAFIRFVTLYTVHRHRLCRSPLRNRKLLFRVVPFTIQYAA